MPNLVAKLRKNIDIAFLFIFIFDLYSFVKASNSSWLFILTMVAYSPKSNLRSFAAAALVHSSGMTFQLWLGCGSSTFCRLISCMR